MIDKLSRLIEHAELWGGMGQAGRTFVEEHYNIDKLNDRLVEIYQSLTAIDTKDKYILTSCK